MTGPPDNTDNLRLFQLRGRPYLGTSSIDFQAFRGYNSVSKVIIWPKWQY